MPSGVWLQHRRYEDEEARSATGQGWGFVQDGATYDQIDAHQLQAGETFQLSNDAQGPDTDFAQLNSIIDWDTIVGAALLDVDSLYVVEISFMVDYKAATGASFIAKVGPPTTAVNQEPFWEDTVLLPRSPFPTTTPVSIGIHLPITQRIADDKASLFITPDANIDIWRNELLFYRVYKAADE